MALVEEAGTEDARACRALASRYLAFVSHAFDDSTRALPQLHVLRAELDRGARLGGQPRPRALGARRPSSAARAIRAGRASAGTSSTRALPAVSGFTSPRAWAFALLGIDEYLRAFQGDSNVQSLRSARWPSGCSASSDGRAATTGRGSRTASTYCNARLPQALIVSGALAEGRRR